LNVGVVFWGLEEEIIKYILYLGSAPTIYLSTRDKQQKIIDILGIKFSILKERQDRLKISLCPCFTKSFRLFEAQLQENLTFLILALLDSMRYGLIRDLVTSYSSRLSI
jgi:hypothetical protein